MLKKFYKFFVFGGLFLILLLSFLHISKSTPDETSSLLTTLSSGSPSRCRDELGSAHAISENGQLIVFVRTCFKTDWWTNRQNKYDSMITDDLKTTTIEEPSMVYVYDNFSGLSYPLYEEAAGDNPNYHGWDVKNPTISDDGKMIAYSVDRGSSEQVYMIRLNEGKPVSDSRVSLTRTSKESSTLPFVNSNGHYIVFESTAQSVSDLLRADSPDTGPIVLPGDRGPRGTQTQPAPETQPRGEGGIPTPPPTTLKYGQIFLYDTTNQTLKMITPSNADGSSRNPSISADGTKIVFSSEATNLVSNDTNKMEDAFLYDSNGGVISKVSSSMIEATSNVNGASYSPIISSDGSSIVYISNATNLVNMAPRVNTDTDTSPPWNLFFYDVANKKSQLVTVPGTIGDPGEGSSWSPSISANGKRIVFMSNREELIPDFNRLLPGVDLLSFSQVYLWDRETNKFYNQSVKAFDAFDSKAGVSKKGWEHLYGNALFPSISADGMFTIFEAKNDLTDPNTLEDFFSWGMIYIKKGLGVQSASAQTPDLPHRLNLPDTPIPECGAPGQAACPNFLPPTCSDQSAFVQSNMNNKIRITSCQDPQNFFFNNEIVEGPKNGSAMTGGDESRYIYYKPNENFYGDDELKFRAKRERWSGNILRPNFTYSNTATLKIHVNSPPTCAFQTGNIIVSRGIKKEYLFNCTDPDRNDSITLDIIKQPEHAAEFSISQNPGTNSKTTLNYRSNPNYLGKDRVVLIAKDDSGVRSKQIFEFNYEVKETPPICKPKFAYSAEHHGEAEPIQIQLECTLPESIPLLTPLVYAVGESNYGKVEVDPATGVATYTPDGVHQTDAFHYSASNGGVGASEFGVVTIRLAPPTR